MSYFVSDNLASSAAVPSLIKRCAAANAGPDAVHPPERIEALKLRNREGGGLEAEIRIG